MNREEFRRQFELLEVEIGASFSEVKRSYAHLKELYSGGSVTLSPILDDISDEEREGILKNIEEAYSQLHYFFAEQTKGDSRTTFRDNQERTIPDVESFSGEALQMIRQSLGIPLHEIALATRIRHEYLENIEKENFQNLPPPVFLKGYLASYAIYLSLDPVRVTADYMEKVRKA